MDTIIIKEVGPADLESLQQISRQTFIETFAGSNTEADMEQYLQQDLSAARLTEELADPHSFFYFALSGDTVIGYLKLNTGKAQTELQQEHSLEIERIYVLQACYGKGVGQVLYEKAVAVARDQKVAYIWLGVWEHNLRAIRFYDKQGFVAFDKHIFRLGKDEQTDIMMKKMLS